MGLDFEDYDPSDNRTDLEPDSLPCDYEPLRKRRGRWCVADIETQCKQPRCRFRHCTHGWTTFCVAVVVEDDDAVHVFWDAGKWSRWVENYDGTVYMHNGGRFDFLFLSRPPTGIKTSGSGIRQARFGRATLRDTLNLFLMPLKGIGKMVGVGKFEGISDSTKDFDANTLMLHCLNDCYVLKAGIESHRAWIDKLPRESGYRSYPHTAGATAVLAAETLEPDAVERWASECPDHSLIVSLRSYVVGGRTEIFHLGEVGPSYVYDRNSSYPASWGEMPVGEPFWTDRERPGLLGVYQVEVDQRDCLFPIINVGSWRMCGRGTATTAQLRRLRERGAKVKVLGGWVTPERQDFGRTIAGLLYPARKSEPGAKVGMNSVHGKFSQGVLFVTSEPVPGEPLEWRDTWELTLPEWYQRPLVGATVLANAALALERVLFSVRQAGWRVFACDTDSVHTDCPPSEFEKIVAISGELGDWKKEASGRRELLLAPKSYAIELDTDGMSSADCRAAGYVRYQGSWWKCVCKGVPKHRRTPELFERALKTQGGVDVLCDAGLVTFRSLDRWEPVAYRGRKNVACCTEGKKILRGTTELRYLD